MGEATSWEFIQEGYDYYYIAHFNKPAGAVTSASISVGIGGENEDYVSSISMVPEYNPPEGPWLGVADVLFPGQQIKEVPFLNDFYPNTETPFHTGLTWLSAQSGDIQIVFGVSCYKGLDLSILPILNINGEGGGGGGGPSITTLAADQVGYAGACARLNGESSDLDAVWFQWGQSATSLNRSTSRLSATESFSQFITGLNPAVVYYFRAVGISGNNLAYGDVLSFLSAGLPPVSTSPKAGFQWIEGSEYHYIDQNGDERKVEGTVV